MWQAVTRNRDGKGRSDWRVLRRLLWLLPVFAALFGGVQAVRPVFAAISVSVGGPYTGTVGQPVTLTASVTGVPSTCTASFIWQFNDNTTMPGQTVVHTYTSAGTFVVLVSVTDLPCLDSASAATTVTVSGGGNGTCTPTTGNPITVSITPATTSVTTGTSVSFGAGVSGAQGATSFSWDFGDNSPPTTTNPTSHTYTTAATFTVVLTVTDGNARIGCATATVTVTGGGGGGGGSNPNIHVAPNGPYTGTTGQLVNFGGFAQTSNSGATITGYQWNFGDNSTGSGQFVSHTYTAANTYTVTLTVTDSTGQSSSATTTATITGSGGGGNTTGTGSATANGVTARTGGPYNGSSGSPINFNATASTANTNATIASCVVSFGESNTSAPCQGATHTYNSNGTYTAVVTVTDSTGATVSASTLVTISGSGGSRSVSLVAGCNNVSSTFADGTSTSTLVNGVSPQSTLIGVWKLSDPATSKYRGYFPGATQASDLPTLNRLDAIFICVNATATLSEPSA